MADRVTLIELSTLPVEARFSTGDSVTVLIYDSTTGLAVPVDSAVCTEILTTGIFTWNFSNLTTQPAVFTRYVWVMTNGSIEQMDYVMAAGYVEQVGAPPVPPDMCKVTFAILEPDGAAPPDSNQIFSDVTDATYAQMVRGHHNGTYYFMSNKMKPSYDAATGEGFWILPIGSTATFLVEQIKVDASAVIPDQTTIELSALLAL